MQGENSGPVNFFNPRLSIGNEAYQLFTAVFKGISQALAKCEDGS